MNIEISTDNLIKYGNPVRGSWHKELTPSPEETTFIKFVFSLFPVNSVSVDKRSNNYLSIIFQNNDFLRFKLTSNTKWISLDLPYELRPKYINSPLFAAQSKKTVRHWKAKLNTVSDMEKYKELIIASCRPM